MGLLHSRRTLVIIFATFAVYTVTQYTYNLYCIHVIYRSKYGIDVIMCYPICHLSQREAEELCCAPSHTVDSEL